MNVTLTPELEQYVNQKVEGGLFPTASDVVREGLRLMREREIRLEELKREIAVGIEQADRGQVAPLDMEAISAKVHDLLAKELDPAAASSSSH